MMVIRRPSRKKMVSRLLVAALVAPAFALSHGRAIAAEPGQALAPSGPANVCLARKPLSVRDRSEIAMFRARMSHLDRIRARTNTDPRFDYKTQLDRIVAESWPKNGTDELVSEAMDILIEEEMKLRLHLTIGLGRESYREFERQLKGILAHGFGEPKRLAKAAVAIKKDVRDHFDFHSPLHRARVFGPRSQPESADETMRAFLKWEAEREKTFASVDAVFHNLAEKLDRRREEVRDSLALYRKVTHTVVGVGIFYAGMVYATPAVVSASAAAGAIGVVGAGCGLGAVGGAAVASLQESYQAFSAAYLESARNGTALSCELRRHQKTRAGADLKKIARGFSEGLVSGCGFVGASMVAPKVVLTTVTASVAVATTYQVGSTGYSAFKAVEAYLTYKALKAMESAEIAANEQRDEEARRHLEEARRHAQQAGAHFLETIINGALAAVMKRDLPSAMRDGRDAIAALLANSADQIPAAINSLLSLYARTAGPGETKTAQNP